MLYFQILFMQPLIAFAKEAYNGHLSQYMNISETAANASCSIFSYAAFDSLCYGSLYVAVDVASGGFLGRLSWAWAALLWGPGCGWGAPTTAGPPPGPPQSQRGPPQGLPIHSGAPPWAPPATAGPPKRPATLRPKP